jgi:NAD(P)-dependent dehydrogenase (short-subunit alcohol dehydrogenase family)
MGKKAVVVGGSNGIGLAITKNLISRNYHVYILDMVEPDISLIGEYTYCPFRCVPFAP